MKVIQTTWLNYQNLTPKPNTIYFINNQDFYVVTSSSAIPNYIQKQYTVVRGSEANTNNIPDKVKTLGLYLIHNTNIDAPTLKYYDGTNWYDIGGSGSTINYETLEQQLISDGFIKKPLELKLIGSVRATNDGNILSLTVQ